MQTVVKRLGLENKKFGLIFVGNIFKCEKYFKNILMKELKEKFRKINFSPLTKNPVKGAVKLAIKI